MSNYIKSTNFAAKDLLAPGTEAKKVKGVEIDDEYNAIETAMGTKADINAPSFTGLPLAPTAGSGTNSTQLATTAFVTTAGNLKADLASPTITSPTLIGIPTSVTAAAGTNTTQIATTAFVQGEFTLANVNAMAYPIGSIYTAIVSTNPATLLGVGTWAAFAAGKMLVGLDSGDTDFGTVLNEGGFKTHTLTTAQMPSHTHTTNVDNKDNTGVSNTGGQRVGEEANADYARDITSSATGGGSPHNNMPPYVTVYMWKRTA